MTIKSAVVYTAAALTATAVLSLGLLACKPAWKKGQDNATSDSVASGVVPQRAGASDATAATPIGFDVDPKTGRTRNGLVLRLDYFPTAGVRPGGTNLPACLKQLAPDFELGMARCESGDTAQKPVYAKNVDQDCYTDGRENRLAASEPVTLPGCRRGQLVVHRFDPPLRIDAEIKEVN